MQLAVSSSEDVYPSLCECRELVRDSVGMYIKPSLFDISIIVRIQDLLEVQFCVFTQKLQPARKVMMTLIGYHHWSVVLLIIRG